MEYDILDRDRRWGAGMARFSVLSGEVKRVVDDDLVPLFMSLGSVAGVARRLNEALGTTGETRLIHSNRLQAMLSGDVSRGVNALTLDLIDRAVTTLRDSGEKPDPARSQAFSREVTERVARLGERGVREAEALQRELGLPQAVLRAVLGHDAPAPSSHPTATPRSSGAGPDWSFQDVAVARTLDAFRRRPHGNIGLVLPTGAGKTRTALRVVLTMLARAPAGTGVIWLTHRKALRRQAHAALRALVRDGAADLPTDARDLASRITFAMISEAGNLLDELDAPMLVVVDEAHHAAAASYRPVFESRHDFPVLLLTATPIRTDRLPIGMDEVAFTITFRELADRGVVLVPEFEAISVQGFSLTPHAMRDLADRIVNELADRFAKTLVLVSTVEQVVAMHEALASRLAEDPEHPLEPDDLGFVHGGGNSHGVDEADFLARFADKPRAALVSAQMLLEGFDDPSIDSVVMTYPTSSVAKLMQAVGRCVRYSPGKGKCYVLQADDPSIAYRFDQRWLYQEIDDQLRPDLVDENFAGRGDLLARVAAHLEAHRVPTLERAAAMEAVAALPSGIEARLLFYGLPYYGPREGFATRAQWGVLVETPENSQQFRAAFNGFSRLGARISDPSEYLETVATSLGLMRDIRAGSLWRSLVEALTSAYFASAELHGERGTVQDGRPYRRHGPTTWLRYVVLHHVPDVPAALCSFLGDCHNRRALEEEYLSHPDRVRMAMKTPLPMGGAEGLLLDAERAAELNRWLDHVRDALLVVEPNLQFERFAALTAGMAVPRLPMAHVTRLERLVTDKGRRAATLNLNDEANTGDRR